MQLVVLVMMCLLCILCCKHVVGRNPYCEFVFACVLWGVCMSRWWLVVKLCCKFISIVGGGIILFELRLVVGVMCPGCLCVVMVCLLCLGCLV